ncbi:BlaI/MecI/CopY family transcriptional regulator [Streptomyces sp. CA-210063]|uniref:BlaI/MecI/CopY family transcriptional regulator n=1 Tax=Streptomyces sp. CA-210063 TaxID=2801029 RepID=UPI00214CF5D4|nr:BlaI/MecI/CopY family transcriptional regulator [Streptomyces sp. CA-210063]UUU29000.1 BlaI/MecI/CopY family transcriptional regulator [Streptomyces sp. CA-210063]
MSENVSATELTSQYSAQVSADLERNAKEQQRIGAEIAALQEQLAAHQRDHAVLVSIQQAIDAAPASAEPAAPSDSTTVPAPRGTKKTAESGTGKRARTKKTAPAPRRGTAGKPAAEKDAGKAESVKTAQPTLVELIRGHLSEQSEPRSAAEIAADLGQAHPDRSVKTTVVRTTLEGLVAKSQAQRSKQGSSVFYTASAAPEQAAALQAEEQPAPADA